MRVPAPPRPSKRGTKCHDRTIAKVAKTNGITKAKAKLQVEQLKLRNTQLRNMITPFFTVVNVRFRPTGNSEWKFKLHELGSLIMNDPRFSATKKFDLFEVANAVRDILRNRRHYGTGWHNAAADVYYTSRTARKTMNIVDDGMSNEDAHAEYSAYRVATHVSYTPLINPNISETAANSSTPGPSTSVTTEPVSAEHLTHTG